MAPKIKTSWNLIDLTGRRFDRLEVKAHMPKAAFALSGGNGALWLCKCDCGAEVVVSGCNLRKRKTRSCGCLRSELAAERMRNRKRRATA